MLVGVDTLRPDCPAYPALLKDLLHPPDPLYCAGQLLARDAAAVAIVGSRTPTPYGIHMARKLARELVQMGLTVVSGMARGIDAAAHESALDAGGRTLAVLGCGLDVDYPKGHRGIRERIPARGALLTEFPEGTPPLPANFPRRNRIISGLALGVVVVEAGSKSGSLITARWALDQGREVMAVPGRVDCPLSAGPLALLRDGAPPVADAADILDHLSIGHQPSRRTAPVGLAGQLVSGPKLPAEIARSMGWPLSRVLAELTRLELEGAVRKDPGGTYSPV
ncbi:MAG: DNA-processing protein DprA [bacterium]|nr:MAG: DNA-processing protein DprA [bacterium]